MMSSIAPVCPARRLAGTVGPSQNHRSQGKLVGVRELRETQEENLSKELLKKTSPRERPRGERRASERREGERRMVNDEDELNNGVHSLRTLWKHCVTRVRYRRKNGGLSGNPKILQHTITSRLSDWNTLWVHSLPCFSLGPRRRLSEGTTRSP